MVELFPYLRSNNYQCLNLALVPWLFINSLGFTLDFKKAYLEADLAQELENWDAGRSGRSCGLRFAVWETLVGYRATRRWLGLNTWSLFSNTKPKQKINWKNAFQIVATLFPFVALTLQYYLNQIFKPVDLHPEHINL